MQPVQCGCIICVKYTYLFSGITCWPVLLTQLPAVWDKHSPDIRWVEGRQWCAEVEQLIPVETGVLYSFGTAQAG